MISKEAKRIYDRKRYFDKIRPIIFGERTCPVCGILLKSKYGADDTRRFCRSCRDRKAFKSFLNREYYNKIKEKRNCQHG